MKYLNRAKKLGMKTRKPWKKVTVIPQEAWEGLDPQNRAALNAQAIAAKVLVLTAECSDDAELTPRIFEAETA